MKIVVARLWGSCVCAVMFGLAVASCEPPPEDATVAGEISAALSAPLSAPARVFGQPDLKQTNYNEVVAFRSFHPAGVLVDRAPAAGTPSRLYVWDSGNSRVLGFDSFGSCNGGSRPGAACTESSFCGAGGACIPSPTQSARFALGQPGIAGQGACNGDNTTTAPASASSLCLVPYPNQTSPLEGARGGQFAVDGARNLYLVDVFNNRVVRYNDPFATDQVADWQWGQPDFQSRGCNRDGAGPTAQTLCTGEIAQNRYWYFFTSAMTVSADGQTIWVADAGNHRVLRLNPNQAAATLVLGQPGFTSADSGCGNAITDASRMCVPTGVAFDAASNTLYVLDGYVEGPLTEQGRILVYKNPTSNGQAPSAIWTLPAGDSFKWPRGLTLEPGSGALWVSDTDNSRALRLVNGAVTHVIGENSLTPDGCTGAHPCNNHGSIGIDNDGALYLSDLNSQRVFKFASGTPLGQPVSPAVAFLFDQPSIGNDQLSANHIGPAGLANPGYVTFLGNQLLVADRHRIVFWNNANNGPLAGGNASGVLAQPSFFTQGDLSVVQGYFQDFNSLAVDTTRNRLYATNSVFITTWSAAGGLANQAPVLEQFRGDSLLTVSGQALTCANGCSFNTIAVDAAHDVGWLVDDGNNRVLRVRDLSTSSRRIDLVLGQDSLAGGVCNRGAGVFNVQPNGFCNPAQVAFDGHGNLYVVDGTWECREGNCRVVEFDASKVPPVDTTLKFPNLTPNRVYGPSDFTSRTCDPATGRLCSPRFIAFDPADGSMIASGEAYHNPIDARLAVWSNPTPAGVTSPLPTAFLGLRINQAGPIAFDGQGRMAVLDHTWNRVTLFNVPAPPKEIRTAFKTFNGKNFITAENDGGGVVSTNRTVPQGWEIFAIEDLNGGALMSGDQIHIRHDSAGGTRWYATADKNGSGQGGGGGPGSLFRVNRTVPLGWETFTITKAGGGQIVNGSAVNLRALNPYYVSAINGGGLVGDGSVVVDRTQALGWETFTLVFQ